MDQPSPPISIFEAKLTYGSHKVLDGLDLAVPAGHITALLGGNGAGKSTTLSCLLGFAKPDSGRVEICGIDPALDPHGARSQIAYLPENVALYDHLTAIENARYLLALSDDDSGRDAVCAAFAAAGLQERAWDQRLGAFSKGMRQKVAIAVALLREVPVLLLDEPTSGLDPRAAADFNQLVAAVRERGTAVLMVTHELLGATDIADTIAFLEGGRIVETIEANTVGLDTERFDLRALHARFTHRAKAA